MKHNPIPSGAPNPSRRPSTPTRPSAKPIVAARTGCSAMIVTTIAPNTATKLIRLNAPDIVPTVAYNKASKAAAMPLPTSVAIRTWT